MNQSNEIMACLERIEKAMNANKSVLTISDLCHYTGYSEQYVYRLTSTRQIPFYKRGKMLFFSREEIDKWLMADRVKTQKEIEAEAETYCALKQ